MTYATWKEARNAAVKRANDMRLSQGIEYSKLDKQWVVRTIPGKTKRFGCDARCEAVEPGDVL